MVDLRQKISLTFLLVLDSSNLVHLAYHLNDPLTYLENDFRIVEDDNSILDGFARVPGSQDVAISSHLKDEQHYEPRLQHETQAVGNVY
jgi:hypothetical protein